MKLQVEFISENIVKPSSPTPSHLSHHQLSFLDQTMPWVFMPWVLFYLKDGKVSNKERCDKVKEALSEALAMFYPLAGRIRGNDHVECNDDGVHFTEAKAKCTLLDFLQDPICNEINKLLRFEIDNVNIDSLAFFQVTYFECGGISIGIGISHRIGDAMSSFMFLNTWAAMARFDPGFEIVKEKIVSKRFVFDSSSIEVIKDKYTEKSSMIEHPRRPTRVEALTAFIWNRFKATTQAEDDLDKVYAVMHAINMRPKMSLPFSGEIFGNIFVEYIVAVSDKFDVDEEECSRMIKQMRNSIRNVNESYVKNLQGDEHLGLLKDRAERLSKGDIVCLDFTSWCRFPIYDIDFGWGNPTWVGSAAWPYHNLVTFLDTKNGDGIEAWVHLKEEDMGKFESDHELNSLISRVLIG
ncbi:hypothetical protein K2173_001687 [Erythroxylum novogranatense]|uniref:Vinorine synthase-like n=1 Tax=Erythroxylum novogranatense TaxID=1862640 RepID=A0AAV8S4U3_9ROSI|nr:hypothetical protein K2173_001687 [Erythroxylum novogranatense]